MYGHPSNEVLKNLKNSKVLRTDINGSIIFKFDKNSYKIKTVLN